MTSRSSPPWSTTTKALVAATALVLTGIVAWAFRGLLQQLVLAALLAYLLHPLVSILENRLGMRRSSAVLLVYFLILIVTLILLSFVGFTTVQEAALLIDNLPVLIDRSPELIQGMIDRLPESISIGPFSIGLAPETWLGFLPNSQEILLRISEQIGLLVGNVLSQGSSIALGALGVVGATVNIVGLLFLVFVISIYIAVDLPRYGETIANLAHDTGYRDDANRLIRAVSRVWASYLRGQVILGLIIFVMVSVALSILRVNNAVGLGLLSGAMEFLPVIGPLIGAGAAILVALFQPETAYSMTQLQYALAVAGVMFLIQQLENNILVPRIVGDALDLNPLLVMISVIMGATLAGLLGAVLAAPVVASLRVLGIYAWRKMFDMPPFAVEQEELETDSANGVWGALRLLVRRARALLPTPLSTMVKSAEEVMEQEEPLYPLKFEPVFKDYIWGGRRLQSVLGREIPAGTVAESWEIAAHTNGESLVATGKLKRMSLSGLMDMFGDRLIGSEVGRTLADDRFPLLIKLLDANQWLSVQVHPDDEYALAHEDDLGKNEMWIVLHAEPEAEIIFGLSQKMTPADFRTAAATGELLSCLHRVAVKSGDVFYVPAGAVHALGPGLLIAEIQQNSDTTYRIYDWDRSGADGKGRPLHVEQAIQVINWEMVRPGPAQPQPLVLPNLEDGQAERVVDSAYFRCERIRLNPGGRYRGSCTGDRFEIWGLLEGTISLGWEAGEEQIESIEWRLLPAALGDFELISQEGAHLIRVTLP